MSQKKTAERVKISKACDVPDTFLVIVVLMFVAIAFLVIMRVLMLVVCLPTRRRAKEKQVVSTHRQPSPTFVALYKPFCDHRGRDRDHDHDGHAPLSRALLHGGRGPRCTVV